MIEWLVDHVARAVGLLFLAWLAIMGLAILVCKFIRQGSGQ